MVEAGTIEEWDAADRRFDLVTAGQAWHWVDPGRGPAKAAQVLRSGGRIGLFWNQAHHDPLVRPALDAAYRRHAPDLARSSVLLGQRPTSLYESVAEALRRTGAFGPVSVLTFDHRIVYSSQEWIDLARTHSDHHTLPPDQLAALLADIVTEVDRVGGQVPVRYRPPWSPGDDPGLRLTGPRAPYRLGSFDAHARPRCCAGSPPPHPRSSRSGRRRRATAGCSPGSWPTPAATGQEGVLKSPARANLASHAQDVHTQQQRLLVARTRTFCCTRPGGGWCESA